jgi:hypothetical protein
MYRACLIRLVQEYAFSSEIALLRVGLALAKGSQLEKLNAFVEADSRILREGGRLSGSALPFDHQLPPIVPLDSSYSRLQGHSIHLASLHGGTSPTASFANQHVWILGYIVLYYYLILLLLGFIKGSGRPW